MRKNRLLFSLIWLILLAIFNLCVFLLRPMIPGLESGFDTRFWIAWAFIIAAFVGNLFCTLFAFRSETQNKMFFKLPLITVSWAALAAMALLGCGLILTPGCSARVAAVACILVLAAHAIAVIQGTWAASAAEKSSMAVVIFCQVCLASRIRKGKRGKCRSPCCGGVP